MTDQPGLYRKKPVTVVALQLSSTTDPAVLRHFMGETRYAVYETTIRLNRPATMLRMWIEKSRAWGLVWEGDWIIAERDGAGHYPCVAAEFAETFEAVSGD